VSPVLVDAFFSRTGDIVDDVFLINVIKRRMAVLPARADGAMKTPFRARRLCRDRSRQAVAALSRKWGGCEPGDGARPKAVKRF
jgi:hypothetical protein